MSHGESTVSASETDESSEESHVRHSNREHTPVQRFDVNSGSFNDRSELTRTQNQWTAGSP